MPSSPALKVPRKGGSPLRIQGSVARCHGEVQEIDDNHSLVRKVPCMIQVPRLYDRVDIQSKKINVQFRDLKSMGSP